MRVYTVFSPPLMAVWIYSYLVSVIYQGAYVTRVSKDKTEVFGLTGLEMAVRRHSSAYI